MQQEEDEPLKSIETFYGFVKDPEDAQILVNACVQGALPVIGDMPLAGSRTEPIRSGSVVVFCENSESMRVRWRDGILWSCSKISQQFLLYREVANSNAEVPQQRERHSNFVVQNVRPNTKLIPNGLAKRTISLRGADGFRYRIISYFHPRDVDHIYKQTARGTLKRPSELSELHQFKGLHLATPTTPAPPAQQQLQQQQQQQQNEIVEPEMILMSLHKPRAIPSTSTMTFGLATPPQVSSTPVMQRAVKETKKVPLESVYINLNGLSGWKGESVLLAPLRPSSDIKLF
ncbi:Gti1/Pac2 family-domain-containing protein [Chytriomyces cf. hyalinus JEL632]|nr:Gti1/Pac2 family-domain-containing protein [Chytriomyces cf. hyalinus JEL632]